MDIQHEQKKKEGRFFIKGEEQNPIAELVYAMQDDGRMVIER